MTEAVLVVQKSLERLAIAGVSRRQVLEGRSMRRLSSPTQSSPMPTPHLYSQLLEQLRQWIKPKTNAIYKDLQRWLPHLQSESACLSQWLYLSGIAKPAAIWSD